MTKRHFLFNAFYTRVLIVVSLFIFGCLHSYGACNGINKVRFSDNTDIADGDVFLIGDLPGTTHIEFTVTGTSGNAEIILNGPVSFSESLTAMPYESQTFTPVVGNYTLTLLVYELLSDGGGLCEERVINFVIGEVVEPDFTEDATDWGVDTDQSKDGGLAFGDYDNDGDLDLLVNTDDNTVRSRLYRNNNDYTFTDVTAALSPYMLTTTRERAAVWGDLNNDGWLDYLRNTSTAGMEVYIQETGGGVFGDGIGGTTPIIFNNSNVSNGVNTEGAGMLDFDGDGDLDIIFDNHNYGIDVLRNNYINHLTGAVINPPAAGLFTHATPGTATILGLAQSATDGDYGSFTDVNDDGWVDIFMRKRDENDFFLNQGGLFSNGADLAQAQNNNKGAVNLYDYDNDGDFDAFWTENDDNQIFRNDNGTWVALGSATGIPTSFSGGNNIDEVASGDIDNDGDIDILLVADKRSYLYINQLNDPVYGKNFGTAMTFLLVPNLEFHSGEDGEGAAMVDIDNDGDLDIYISVEDGPNQLFINDQYTTSTLEASKNYLFIKVIDDRPEYMQSGRERMALGATVLLEDCEGNVISGLRELNGGNGHGTQDPPIVHFGLPDGPNFDYRVVVKYPNWINPSGDTIRQVVSKWIRPSLETTFPITIEFRPSDSDIACPQDICDFGIDSDADGIRDICDLDDDNDGILDYDEGHICETLDISSLDGTINDVSDFNAAQINVAGSIIQIDDPLTFGGSASIDEFGVNDNHETGSFGFQLGVNSFGASDYLETHYLFSKDVCNFNARILDIDVSDALDISGFLDGVAVTYMITYQGSCVTYDGTNTFSSTCLVNSNPGAGNVDDHAINIEFNSCIDSMAIRIYENGAGSGGSYTFVLSPDPTCTYRDTDDDGITDHLDLDSDNDGIFDLDEAGHNGVDSNEDGIIDGAPSTFGTNGLHFTVETSTNNGLINYAISDSETTPDGVYDAYELDSDGDGCYDAHEENVVDGDDDGIVGTGIPVVDSAGLVISHTYVDPPNNFWQDDIYVSLICDTDNDNINPVIDLDDDNDGLLDTDEGICFEYLVDFNLSNEGWVEDNYNDGSNELFVEHSSYTFSQNGCSFASIPAGPSGAFIIADDNYGGDMFFENSTNLNLDASALLDVGTLSFYWINGTYSGTGSQSGSAGNMDVILTGGGQSVSANFNAVGLANTNTWHYFSFDINDATWSGSLANLTTVLGDLDQITIKVESINGNDLENPATNCSSAEWYGLDEIHLNCSPQDTDGDLVYDYLDLDSDNDGIFDLDESGHNGVDANNDGIIDGAPSTFGVNGLHDSVETAPDNGNINYTISDSETTPDGTYDAYELDSDGDGCYDAEEENVIDGDDDGVAGSGVASVDSNGLVLVHTYIDPPNNFWQDPLIGPCLPEVCNDNLDNDGDGLIDCLDGDCGLLNISTVVVGPCIDDPLADRATLDVTLDWNASYSNDIIEVSIYRKTEYIDIDVLSSPQTVSFNIPADGSIGDSVIVTWQSATNPCIDFELYNAPVACSNDSISCSILYLCSFDKPYDGDSWDHGWLEYLDNINGDALLTPVVTKDEPGLGLYDAMDTSMVANIDFDLYDIIIISPTTEFYMSSDLVDTLKNLRSSILNSNQGVTVAMGYGTSTNVAFQEFLYTDDVTTVGIYNFNNVNGTGSPVFTGSDVVAGGDDYLWMYGGGMTNGTNGSFIEYEANDSLPIVGYDHGKRVLFGYHMNGVYGNPVNGGVTPVPVSGFFDPIRHLTGEGKIFFDQAILSVSNCEALCNTAIMNPHVMYYRRSR